MGLVTFNYIGKGLHNAVHACILKTMLTTNINVCARFFF